MFSKTVVVRDNMINSFTNKLDKPTIRANIKAINDQIDCHEICSVLTSTSRIKAFASYYTFYAWDKNKLVRPLLSKISILSSEKSDEYNCKLQRLLEDFANYLYVLEEIGVNSDLYFPKAKNDLAQSKPEIKALIEYNSSIANTGTISEKIVVLLLGNKQLDQRAFSKIVRVCASEANEYPFLLKYTKKLCQSQSFQAELQVFELLDRVCQDEAEQKRALLAGWRAVYLQKQLWDRAWSEVRNL